MAPTLLPLAFLRPAALPRPTTVQRFLSASTSASLTRTSIRSNSTSTSTTTTTTTRTTPLPPTAPPSTASNPRLTSSRPQTATTTATPTPKPYRLTLTPSHQYPIYNFAKRGGNMKLTRVKRIEGDLAVLRQDLQTVLGLEDGKAVVVNPVTRQVIVKGHFKSQIQQFFQDNPTTVVAAA